MSDDERIRLCLEAYLTALEAGEDVSDLRRFTEGDPDLTHRLESLIDIDIAAENELSGETATAPRLPFESLGDFKLIAPLGSGGMGRVFIAEQKSLRRLVAIKILDDHAFGDANARKRFRREAEIAASLDHPNIVPIYAVGEDRGAAWIAMRWLSGPGLDAIERPVAINVAAKVGMAVAQALDEAHKAGIIHRDVKPANIIMNDGVPIVVDFGLAKQQSDVALTKTGVVPGTLPYMAPELLRERGAAFDPRIDVYALGATLYEILSGRPPFPDTDTEVLVRKILLDEPSPLRLAAKDRDLETIILRAIDKDPARRFATAGDMADEIGRFLRGDAILSRRRSFSERTVRYLSRHKRGASAIAGSVLIFGGMAVWSFWSKEVAEFEASAKHAAECTAVADQMIRRLEADDFEGAEATFKAVSERIRNDDRLEGARRMVDARRALEDLYDCLSERPDARNRRRLGEAIRRYRSTDGDTLRPNEALLALALANFDCGRDDESRSALLGIGGETASQFARPRAAILALLDRTPAERLDLPDSPATTIDARVVTFMALRRIASGDAHLADEIEKMRAQSTTHRRAQIAQALYFSDTGRRAEAFGAFSALGRTRRDDSLVRRNLARLAVEMDDFAEAERHLAGINVEDDPLPSLLRYQIADARGDRAGASKILEDAAAKWPEDPEVDVRRAGEAYRSGRFADAIQLARSAERGAFYRETKHLAESLSILAEIEREPNGDHGERWSRLDTLFGTSNDASMRRIVGAALVRRYLLNGEAWSAAKTASVVIDRQRVDPKFGALLVIAVVGGGTVKGIDDRERMRLTEAAIDVGFSLLDAPLAEATEDVRELATAAILALPPFLLERKDYARCRGFVDRLLNDRRIGRDPRVRKLIDGWDETLEQIEAR